MRIAGPKEIRTQGGKVIDINESPREDPQSARSKMESLRGQIERISILAIGVIATAISLADMFGVLDGFPFIKAKIPVFVLLILGILSVYLVFERRGSLDTLEKHLQQLTTNVNAIDPKLDVVAQRIGDVVLHGAEFFHSTDELLTRMTELTIGSEHVSTLNLSQHRGSSPALDRYFDQVHEYMRRTSSPMKSFRNLATLENPGKAKWVMERAIYLIDTGKMSTGVMPSVKFGFLICFRIVLKRGQSYVFIYPPINPGGALDGLLFRDPQITNIMLKYFDAAWGASSLLHEGKRVYEAGLGLIAQTDPNLKTEAAYIELSKRL